MALHCPWRYVCLHKEFFCQLNAGKDVCLHFEWLTSNYDGIGVPVFNGK